MLIGAMSLISIISLCTGCNRSTVYDYREEEASKLVRSDNSDSAPVDVQTGLLESPQIVDSSIAAIEDTICDCENLLMYNYELRLNKAVCYFAIPNLAFFNNLVFTIEEYDTSGNLINTVKSDTIDYVGTYVAKITFPADERVNSIKVVQYDFESMSNNFTCTNNLSLESVNELMGVKPLSNTTFEFTKGENRGLILLDENCVQIDMVVFDSKDGQFITKQGVAYYKLVKFN